MALKQISAPAVEPITLADAKAFLRIDTDTEDALVESLIITSRLHIEDGLDVALIDQDWRLTVTCPAARHVTLPLHPVREILSVAIVDPDGVETDVPLSDVSFDVDVRPQSLTLPHAISGHLVITFRAGFGATADDVPSPIRHALKQLVAHWFEVREPIHFGSSATRIPETINALLMPYRAVKL